MRLSPANFNRFLGSKIGQSFAWRRAYACPCINPNSNAAKPGCPICNGKGRSWDAAIDGAAGIAGQEIQTAWAKFGTAEVGDVVLTIPSNSPLYAMSQFDRVVMSNASQPFSQVLKRGMNDVLRFPVVDVERVFWLNPAGTAQIEGGIPVVAANGTMSWTTGEPPAGTQYSITGRSRPEYFCYTDFARDRSHQFGDALPRRVVLRKFDLYGR